MFLDLWITSEVGNLVLIYMRSFFKDSYFATTTAVIINVHFSITCLLLSYSSPSTTLCIITVTHCKSGGGQRRVCVRVCMCAHVCVVRQRHVFVIKLTKCVSICVSVKYVKCFSHLFVCVCLCIYVCE